MKKGTWTWTWTWTWAWIWTWIWTWTPTAEVLAYGEFNSESFPAAAQNQQCMKDQQVVEISSESKS